MCLSIYVFIYRCKTKKGKSINCRVLITVNNNHITSDLIKQNTSVLFEIILKVIADKVIPNNHSLWSIDIKITSILPLHDLI